MQLENEFTVPVPLPQVWQMMLDVERIAPCLPGATVDRMDGDEVAGRVKVKVGPVQLSYAGTARFRERDEASHRLVLDATGRETRGSGTASASIETRMSEQDSGTRVTVLTDLNVTGKPAQFGRGVLADVAGKLTEQFAACLAQRAREPAAGTVDSTGGAAQPEAAAAASTPAAAASPPATAAQPTDGQAPVPEPAQPQALDLLGTVGLPALKRAAPALSGLLVGLVVGSVLSGRRRSQSGCSIVITPAAAQEAQVRTRLGA